MYADYLQHSAQQSVKPNKVGPVLVTIGAHAALITMLAMGLKVVVNDDLPKDIEVVDIPPIEQTIVDDPLPEVPRLQQFALYIKDVEIPISPPETGGTEIRQQPFVIGDGGGIEVGSVEQVATTNASIVRSFQPPYPLVSRARDEEGTVIVKILITPFGTAGDVQVEKSSGFSRLDEAAVKAAREWKFAPARRGSQAIAMWVSVPVKFVLNAGR